MGLEAGTWVSDLDVNNPVAGDPRNQGDDHLRLIKSVLKNTFPNASKAQRLPTSSAKTADFTVASTDQNVVFSVGTSSGSVTITLPTLSSPGDHGWVCYFVKVSTDTNPMFVQPAAGTLMSGPLTLTKTRRCIPGKVFAARWLSSIWVIERCID